MAGAVLTVQTPGLDQAITKASNLRSFEMATLIDVSGAVIESSVKRRLNDEKTAPDGTPWPEWSEEYAATRGSEHSLLVDSNALLESVQSFSSGTEAIVGSNLVYAARRQFGGEELGYDDPARPFLGLSDLDEADLLDISADFLGGLLQ